MTFDVLDPAENGNLHHLSLVAIFRSWFLHSKSHLSILAVFCTLPYTSDTPFPFFFFFFSSSFLFFPFVQIFLYFNRDSLFWPWRSI